jgi:hypothetical protein
MRWREGTKGDLIFRFAAVRVNPGYGCSENQSPPPPQWLLMQWPNRKEEPPTCGFAFLPIKPIFNSWKKVVSG